jgi:hypothetical protein
MAYRGTIERRWIISYEILKQGLSFKDALSWSLENGHHPFEEEKYIRSMEMVRVNLPPPHLLVRVERLWD